MAQDATPTQPAPQTVPQDKGAAGKKKTPGKWFRKIPTDILFSPGGIFLMVLAAAFEILDPLIPGGSLTVEIIPEVIFCFFLAVIAKQPFQSLILPFLVERIPVLSDILPTWFIKLIL